MARGRSSAAGLVKMALMFALATLVVVLLIRWTNRNPDVITMNGQMVFQRNVFVNGTELAGMTYAEGMETLERQTRERFSSPIELTYAGQTFSVTPAELDAQMEGLETTLNNAFSFGNFGTDEQKRDQIALLAAQPAAYTTELTWNEEKADAFIQTVTSAVNVAPVNSEVTVGVEPIFQVSPHQDGWFVREDTLRQILRDALLQGGASRVELQPEVWPAEYTYERRQAGTQLVARVVTDSRSSTANRVKNIMRALKPFNAMTLQPNEAISFNQIVGKRAPGNGFFEAPEFLDGETVTGYGGGTCQASTTLYGALRRAGIQIDQRWPHSQIVQYISPSLDATVTDSGRVKDLVFTNTTGDPYYIYTYVSYQDAIVEIYGQKPAYRIEFVSRVVETLYSKDYKTVPDTQGLYARAPGQTAVYKEGKDGYITESWLYYYDWDSGELATDMPAERVSRDTYQPVPPTLWVYAG